MCWPNENSDIKGVNQCKKSDSVEKEAMMSSTTMEKFHQTQTHFSADYNLQPHYYQNTNPIFTVLRNTEYFKLPF